MGYEKENQELLAHLKEEFREHGVAAVDFIVTASTFLEDGDPTRQPRLGEVVAYCAREALKRILESVKVSSGQWRSLSRQVSRAKEAFLSVKGLPGGDEAGALDDLLSSIDDLSLLHEEQSIHQRRLIAVLISRTGSSPIESRKGLVLEYQRLIDTFNSAVHNEIDWGEARSHFEETLNVLRQLFLPPDARLAQLDELAAIEEPDSAAVLRLQELVTSASHLSHFFESIITPSWLEALTDTGLLTPPEGQAHWPVFVVVEKLNEDYASELADWLDRAYDTWGNHRARAWYLVRAAADVLPSGEKIILRALHDYPDDPTICQTIAWALRDVDPAGGILKDVADYLLNPGSGLARFHGLTHDGGILGKLASGINQENGIERVRMLCFKLKPLSDDGTTGRLILAERGGSISEPLDSYRNDLFSVLLATLTSSIKMALKIGIDFELLLEMLDPLEADLRDRLRAWLLGTANASPASRSVEVASAIRSRRPCGDDLRLVDLVAQDLPLTDFIENWAEALGLPPSSESIAAALSSHSVQEDWFRARDWVAILPPDCTAKWTTAVALLSAVYGPADRSRFESRMKAEFGTSRSPMTSEEIAALGPLEAARTIAAWQPSSGDWLVTPIELARSLQETIEQDSESWLDRPPLEIIGGLRHPVYISHYFSAIAKTAVDLSGSASLLVEAISFCRSHPWEPEGLSSDHLDYEPGWDGVDRAGISLLQKLAESDTGFGNRADDAWKIVLSAAEDRSGESFIIAPRDDALETAINRDCTRALEAAISMMAFEFRQSEFVRPELLELIEEALHLEGRNGAEHRAIIAPRLGFFLHVARDWVEQYSELLFGAQAPNGLAQTTVDLAIKWGRPNRWVFEKTLNQIIDACSRDLDNAMSQLLIGALWEVPGYEPDVLVERLAQIKPDLLSDAGEALGRLLSKPDLEKTFVEVGLRFWKATLSRTDANELGGFGWWAEVPGLDRPEWEEMTLATVRKTQGRLDWAHKVAERVAEAPITVEGLDILNELVRGQVDEWDRMAVMDTAIQALRATEPSVRSSEAFRRLRTSLIERGRSDVREIT